MTELADDLTPIERNTIDRYVFEYAVSERETYLSTFRALVRDARRIAGRDVDTGKMMNRADASLLPAALLYLVLLDQLGKVLSPAPRRAPVAVPIRQALHDFAPELGQREVDTLYALRNAFAHEFALANEGRKLGQPDPCRHIFQLADAPDDDRLMVHPDVPWNGKYGDECEGGETAMNLFALEELIEEIIERVEAGARQGSLCLVEGLTRPIVAGRWGIHIFEPDES